MRPGDEGSVKVCEKSLGKVSVVQMARAVVSQASWVEVRFSCAVGIFERILEIGRLEWPYQLACFFFFFFLALRNGDGWHGIPLPDHTGAHDEGTWVLKPVTLIHRTTHADSIL